MARKGFPIVLSAPSGTGKTTLAHLLNNSMDKLALSVSYTTRPIRGSEQEGVNYHFIDNHSFKQMIDKDEFLEWACVHGNYYGSGAQWTAESLESGKDVLFDIDVQGGLQIKAHYPDAVTIFITPPSFEELEKRLLSRGTESHEHILKRLASARDEIKIGLEKYDYVINNEKLDRALFDLTSIIRTHHIMRIDRQKIENRLFQ
ncbi:MAG: guanylate kinase [Myxococcales bacterium]|nr:guanylate kinase [Myxococcales bacterium]USN50553.1 MAG: guanylate kinase [Myxococcales bacterium]